MLAEVDIAPSRTVSSAIIVSLGGDGQTKILMGAEFAGQRISDDQALIPGILPFENPQVNSAISAALRGSSQVVSYSTQIDGREIFCELRCHPDWNGHQQGLICQIIDRTAEQIDSKRLRERVYLLDMISQAVRAFAETRNLSEILRIILLGVTAGPGLGFNRGFILLSNESRTQLWGCLATGPSTAEEAGTIWQELASHSLTLEEILRLYKSTNQNAADIHINKLVGSLKISLSDDSNFIVRAAKSGRSLITGPGNQQLIDKFGSDHMAVVPLISREGLQGVLLADNLINRKTITQADLRVLEIFARYASDAIENSRLYGRLEQQICRLKEANDKIIRSRENLVKAEKLSSVAKIALDVAHEIRNPLTVIGGYANSCLRKLGMDDPSYRFFEIISRQAGRIENALDRFSSVVTLSEKKEGKFCLVNLVREALGMLSGSGGAESPILLADSGAKDLDVFLDQGLFYQVMMVILRKAAAMVNGMANISIMIARNGQTGVIYILSSDNYPNFAENFYRTLRDRDEELKNQEIAVALEILQHYGGGIGIISENKGPLRLYIEFPLCEVVSTEEEV
jgi:signal transduction histidine kinase